MTPAASVPLPAMIAQAQAAAQRAYARYSGFRVGACLCTNTGRLVAGCNVENVSIGLSHCAERTAVTRAIAEGALDRAAGDVIVGVVVYTPTPTATMPCGMCRQVLAEFAPPEAMIVAVCDDPQAVVQTTLGALFPSPFVKP